MILSSFSIVSIISKNVPVCFWYSGKKCYRCPFNATNSPAWSRSNGRIMMTYALKRIIELTVNKKLKANNNNNTIINNTRCWFPVVQQNRWSRRNANEDPFGWVSQDLRRQFDMNRFLLSNDSFSFSPKTESVSMCLLGCWVKWYCGMHFLP